jgi:hypothetical protein
VIRRLVLAALAVAAVLLVAAAGVIYWFLAGDASRRALERQATQWLGQPVRIGASSVAFLPRVTVRLRDIRVGEPVRVTLAEVDIAAALRPLLSRRLEDATVTVVNSRLDLPLPFSLPVTAQSESRVVIRSIALRDVVLANRGREIRVSADSSLANTRLTLTTLTATSGKTTVEATGTVELSPRIDAAITARTAMLDGDDLIALVGAFATPAGGAAPDSKPPRLTVDVEAPAGIIAGVAISRIAATVRADGHDVSIEPLAFDVFGGRHNGWFDAALGDGLSVRLGASVSNVDAARLAAFGGEPGALTGRLDASARLGGSGPDLAAVLGSLRGAGEVVVSNGSVRGLDLVAAVVRFLGRAPAERQTSGTPFERIAGNFALSDGRLRSDDLSLHSPDFDIFARGTLRLDTDALDGRAEVVLSEALSAQAGRDVYRYARTGTRVVLPATVGGTLGQPRIRFDAAAAVRQAIGNEIERRLSDLLDMVRGR